MLEILKEKSQFSDICHEKNNKRAQRALERSPESEDF